MENDNRHPIHGLKMPKYTFQHQGTFFFKISTAIDSPTSEERIKYWKQMMLEKKSRYRIKKELNKNKFLT